MVDWLSDNNLSLTLHVPNLYIKKEKSALKRCLDSSLMYY